MTGVRKRSQRIKTNIKKPPVVEPKHLPEEVFLQKRKACCEYSSAKQDFITSAISSTEGGFHCALLLEMRG